MATHPVPSEAPDQVPVPDGEPNPSRLPVEPEFGPLPPAAEPEDPTVHKPAI